MANCPLLLESSLHFLMMQNLFFILIPNSGEIMFLHSFLFYKCFLLLKSTKQNTHYVSCYGCVVDHNYNKPEAVHSFYFMKNNFFPRKLCFFTVSIFEFNAFSNKIPETAFAFVEWFTMNIAKCPLLLACSRCFCLMKNLFPFQNSWEIMFIQLFHVLV